MRMRLQQGLSLVELMVAMALGVLLLSGVLSIFMSSKVTYLTNEKTARLQENGRLALELMVHDLRSAGYTGCARESFFTTTLIDSADVLWNYVQPVQGFESLGDGDYAPALTLVLDPAPIPDSDVVVVRMPVRDRPAMTMRADLANVTDNPQVLAASGPVAAGQIMVITDCQAATIFQATGWGAGAPNGSILHDAGGAGPGNATADLGFQYLAGARLLPIETVTYWVGDNGTGPALWRRMGDDAAEMLVEGVQGLQVAYGEDTDADRVANDYFSADDIGDWDDVISVNFSLLARSEEIGPDVDGSTYQLLEPALGGMTLGPYDDRRQRMLFTTTAALRNRAL
ncbi:MAG: PilW family protein [Steroidobacteraceae bacterium]